MEAGSANRSGSQLSSNMIVVIISSLFILVILYPWIIAVSVFCFILGFSGLEPIDQFIKTSISSGRFGETVQTRFKDYINLTGDSESQRNVITEVTEDPLRDFVVEEEEHNKTNIQQQQQQKHQANQQENDLLYQKTNNKINEQLTGNTHPVALGSSGIHNTLIIPARLSSSNRSSPEKNKPLFESPKRSLSAASSRRVSEDIPGGPVHSLMQPFAVVGGISGIYPQKRDVNSKTPSPSRPSTPSKTPSPSITLNPEIVGVLRVDQEFRVNIRVDKAFGRMFTNIIDYYISPSWAPYETRRQLKLNLRQLLNSVAEQCNRKLLYHNNTTGKSEDGGNEFPINGPIVKLAREKLLPLALHYLDKTLARGVCPNKNGQEDPIISKESKRRVVLKIRKFCRQIFERFLGKDDRNCKLWMELCVAVLADGVLVNVMHLGRDTIPELLEELVARFKKSARASASVQPSSPVLKQRAPSRVGSVKDEFVDPLSDDFVEALQEQPVEIEKFAQDVERRDANSNSPQPLQSTTIITETQVETIKDAAPPEKVPFLLDSFLDPPFNLEKPDPIVSRWRPTLKDIVSETDLLYPLIQYMKHVGGQQSLAYLQGILDEFPLDGDPYCRRILELEYLPGFCRSSLFLETMGLSRVEVAMEVGTDPFSMMRRNSSSSNAGLAGHARSASYGGPSTSSFREFLKIEQGIVDGLPLTETGQQNVSASSSSSEQSTGAGSVAGSSSATLPVAGEIQPSLAFKRRPHLEMYIAKFIKSTSKSWKQYYDPLAEQNEVAKREGIEAKSYDEWDHPEVHSRVKIESSTAEIYDSFIDLVSSLMRNSPVASPFFSGLTSFLKPYLMPIFNEQLEKNLTHVLTEDLLVTVVDLIADVFEEPTDADDTKSGTNQCSNENGLHNNMANEYGNCYHFATSTSVEAGNNTSGTQLLTPHNNNASEEESHDYHNSSCTTCDPSFKSTIESFLSYVLECFMLKLIDLDYFVKCFSENREYIFLFFVDLLDVLVAELVEK